MNDLSFGVFFPLSFTMTAIDDITIGNAKLPTFL